MTGFNDGELRGLKMGSKPPKLPIFKRIRDRVNNNSISRKINNSIPGKAVDWLDQKIPKGLKYGIKYLTIGAATIGGLGLIAVGPDSCVNGYQNARIYGSRGAVVEWAPTAGNNLRGASSRIKDAYHTLFVHDEYPEWEVNEGRLVRTADGYVPESAKTSDDYKTLNTERELRNRLGMKEFELLLLREIFMERSIEGGKTKIIERFKQDPRYTEQIRNIDDIVANAQDNGYIPFDEKEIAGKCKPRYIAAAPTQASCDAFYSGLGYKKPEKCEDEKALNSVYDRGNSLVSAYSNRLSPTKKIENGQFIADVSFTIKDDGTPNITRLKPSGDLDERVFTEMINEFRKIELNTKLAGCQYTYQFKGQ